MIDVLDEMIEAQKKTLYGVARRIVPKITEDDLLQPNDFPELEMNGYFRYEEGILAGLQMAKSALLLR